MEASVWPQTAALYAVLLQAWDNPGVPLNHVRDIIREDDGLWWLAR